MEQNNNKGESKYERLRRIGIGSYGIVFKCVNRQTGQIVAIKRYSENDTDPIIRKIAMREVRVLRQLKHPNLINLIEVFRRKRRLHLVFDYCELTVLDVIEKYGNNCPLNLIRKIVWQIVNGTNYCHSRNCIHRDIKPENILINQSGVVKLCDFGFARTIDKLQPPAMQQLQQQQNSNTDTTKSPLISRDSFVLDPNNLLPELEDKGDSNRLSGDTCLESSTDPSLLSDRQALTEYVATRWYRAPELLIGEIYYDVKIDIWAIGCVTAELMRGDPIWPGKTDLDQLFIIKNSLGQLTPTQTQTLISRGVYDQLSVDRVLENQMNSNESVDKKLPARVGDIGIDFVSVCLQMDPNKRPTCEQLLRHEYIHSARMTQFMKSAQQFTGNGGRATMTLAPISEKDTQVNQTNSQRLREVQPVTNLPATLKPMNRRSESQTMLNTTESKSPNNSTTCSSKKRSTTVATTRQKAEASPIKRINHATFRYNKATSKSPARTISNNNNKAIDQQKGVPIKSRSLSLAPVQSCGDAHQKSDKIKRLNAENNPSNSSEITMIKMKMRMLNGSEQNFDSFNKRLVELTSTGAKEKKKVSGARNEITNNYPTSSPTPIDRYRGQAKKKGMKNGNSSITDSSASSSTISDTNRSVITSRRLPPVFAHKSSNQQTDKRDSSKCEDLQTFSSNTGSSTRAPVVRQLTRHMTKSIENITTAIA